MFREECNDLAVVASVDGELPMMPWEREPRRLWSRLDMKPIETSEIARAIANVATARGLASVAPMTEAAIACVTTMFQDQLRENNIWITVEHTNDNTVAEEVRSRALKCLIGAKAGLVNAALPKRFHDKMARILEHMTPETFDGAEVKVRLDELLYDLLAELRTPMFLYVAPEKRELYEQIAAPFGELVQDKFPDAAGDIAAAGRCLALDEPTACVFHLMRVLEHGLRAMATQFGVPFQVDSWHKVIKGIEDGIATRRNTNKPGGLTEKDRAEITHYSDAASQFRYFKDAWRNHVSHARVSYSERDAEKVWTHTKEFMQALAAFV